MSSTPRGPAAGGLLIVTDAAFVGGQRLVLAERVADRWGGRAPKAPSRSATHGMQMGPTLAVQDGAEGFL